MGLTGKGPYFAPREQSLGKYCLMCGFAVAEPWLCVVCCGSSCFEYPTGPSVFQYLVVVVVILLG